MNKREISYEEYCHLIQSGEFVSNEVSFTHGKYTVKVNTSNELKDVIDICKEFEVKLDSDELKKMLNEVCSTYILVHVNNNILNHGLKEYSEIIDFNSLYDSVKTQGGKNYEL